MAGTGSSQPHHIHGPGAEGWLHAPLVPALRRHWQVELSELEASRVSERVPRQSELFLEKQTKKEQREMHTQRATAQFTLSAPVGF